MASQISINTEAAAAIVSNTRGFIEEITELMTKLDAEVNKLLTDGDWRGDAADKFFNVYDDIKETFIKDVPDNLNTLNENIDKNLSNLIEADATGAR